MQTRRRTFKALTEDTYEVRAAGRLIGTVQRHEDKVQGGAYWTATLPTTGQPLPGQDSWHTRSWAAAALDDYDANLPHPLAGIPTDANPPREAVYR